MSFDEDDDSAPAIQHHLADHPALASMVRDITSAARNLPADERHWQISEALGSGPIRSLAETLLG